MRLEQQALSLQRQLDESKQLVQQLQEGKRHAEDGERAAKDALVGLAMGLGKKDKAIEELTDEVQVTKEANIRLEVALQAIQA